MKKRDNENVIICPRCMAKNLSSQKKCGRCGYVFPHKEIEKGKQKRDNEAFGMGFDPNLSQGAQGLEQQDQTQEQQEPSEPQISRTLMARAQSEGHIRGISIKTICDVCQAQNSPHSKRCIKCGKRFIEKKK